MRSDELVDRARKAADIGSVAAWPDFTDARIMQELTERHLSLMSDEEVRARAGYGSQKQVQACASGTNVYPVPSRAIGGAFEKVEIYVSPKWCPLTRVEVTGAEQLETERTGRPTHFCVQDGFIELYPTPDSTYSLRFTFFMRPSAIVTSQSSTLGGDGVDRGRITVAPVGTGRTITVNALPFDQSLASPAAITTAVQSVDIVRPNGTFALAAWSMTQSISGLVITLGGTNSLARVQVGDYLRVADQADWPMGLPAEFHRMVANRAAMELARDMGIEEKMQALGQVCEADLKRFRNVRSPQVKSAPIVIPLRPMWSR